LQTLSASSSKSNPLFFEVDAGYELPLDGSGTDPLDRPSVLGGTYDETTESYFVDKSSTPQKCVNKANDRFENFPQRRTGNLLIQITKNISTWPAIAYDTLKFTRNADAVTIRGTTYATNTLLLLPAGVAELRERVAGTNYHFYGTTFRLLTDHNLHVDSIENRGYFELVSGKRRQIFNDDGSVPTTPWPLNDDGTKMASPSDAPTLIDLEPYASVSWGLDFD